MRAIWFDTVFARVLVAGAGLLSACAIDGVATDDDTRDEELSVDYLAGPSTGPDLIESAVSSPPSTVTIGSSFSVTDTVQNVGTVDAGASQTRYYLSPDGVTISGAVPLGGRSVGAIAVNGSATGSGTATIPEGTTVGSYYVLACADRPSAVAEVDETNNCAASTGLMIVNAPDLTESNVSASPSTVSTGEMLNITETVNNIGSATAGGSTTRFFFSADAAKSPDDAFIRACIAGDVTPGRLVQAMASGASNSGTTAVPLCVIDSNGLHAAPPGTYYVIACADELKTVGEASETNNCAASAGTVTVTDGGSDLVVTAVSNPPATANLNTSFSVTETVRNLSASTSAGASSTRYFLSLDATKSGADPALTGARAVPSLAPNATNSGSANVTVPSGTSAGTYYLLACADGDTTVPESNETNNCRASSTTVTIGGPDLITTQMSNPPTTGSPGTSFSVIDRVQNIGNVSAPQTITRYYLSLNGTQIVGVSQLGQRTVLGLLPGGTDGGAATLTIPTGTAQGTYFILACADRGFVVAETNENNNCRASVGTIAIGAADLVETNVSVAPATIRVGDLISVTETVDNLTTSAAPASVTRFYLSTDNVKSANDGYMWDCVGSGPISQRNVPALAGLASSTGTTTMPSCVYDAGGLHAIAPGTYFMIACADVTKVVGEASETNNCTASSASFTVTP